jgi:YVTN family beta-propeller protein
MGAPVFGLSLTPDNAQLYATSPETGMLWIVDRASRAQVKTLPVGGTPRRIAFDERGTRAVVSNEAGFVTIIE